MPYDIRIFEVVFDMLSDTKHETSQYVAIITQKYCFLCFESKTDYSKIHFDLSFAVVSRNTLIRIMSK